MREASVKLYLELMMEGLDAIRYQDEAWGFAQREGIPHDYEQTNPVELREQIVKYLIEKTRVLYEGGLP